LYDWAAHRSALAGRIVIERGEQAMSTITVENILKQIAHCRVQFY